MQYICFPSFSLYVLVSLYLQRAADFIASLSCFVGPREAEEG